MIADIKANCAGTTKAEAEARPLPNFSSRKSESTD